MQRTEPVNPESRVSILLRFFLYPTVTTLKVIKIVSAPDTTNFSYSRLAGFGLILLTEITAFNYLFPSVNDQYFMRFLCVIFLYHGIPEFFFEKKAIHMASDYYAYYSKPLLYIYFIFLAIALVCICLTFYHEIGHVPNYK